MKNIVFDIGNVILNFKLEEVLLNFTSDINEKEFIIKNIVDSPEWLGYGLIDTGFISKESAIEIVKDRTNHENDELLENFWNNYNNYSKIDNDVLKLIKKIKANNYNVYLLSNINKHTHESIIKSGLFEIVDGYVFSYMVNKVKPYQGIYKDLLNKYNLSSSESLFIDDNENNVKTANELGFNGEVVIPDNYESIIKLLDKFDIKYN